jgi:hypothetical protein
VTEHITPTQFRESDGVDGWRVLAAPPAHISALRGSRLVSDEHAPTWWTLADSEGNEVDVATTLGRDEPWVSGWRRCAPPD